MTMRCRFCGSTSLHEDTQHKTFSAGKAVAGAVVLGAVGAAAGFIGKEKKGYRCGACGSFMELPMDTFTAMQIDTAIRDAAKGNVTLYHYYKSQYPNIETVTVAPQASVTAPVNREIEAPRGTFDQEEKVKRSYRYGSWSPDVPVYVESVVLKTNGEEDRMSLIAWNQSGKEIRSLYLNVTVFDDTDDEIKHCRCVYQNMEKNNREPMLLPVDKTFSLGTDVAYRVQIEQEKASFEDDTAWRASGTEKVYTLPEQSVLTRENFPRIEYVQSKYAAGMSRSIGDQQRQAIRLYMPDQEEDFWMCDCGHPAKKDAPCPYCQDKYSTLIQRFEQKTLIQEQQRAVKARAMERAQRLQPLYRQLVEEDEEARYAQAVQLFNSSSIADVEKARDMLLSFPDRKEARDLAAQCNARIEQIRAEQQKRQAEAERRAAEQKKEEIAKKRRRNGAPSALFSLGFSSLPVSHSPWISR